MFQSDADKTSFGGKALEEDSGIIGTAGWTNEVGIVKEAEDVDVGEGTLDLVEEKAKSQGPWGSPWWQPSQEV